MTLICLLVLWLVACEIVLTLDQFVNFGVEILKVLGPGSGRVSTEVDARYVPCLSASSHRSHLRKLKSSKD